jgi:hypothetical protein
MPFTRDTAVARAKTDLAARLNISADEIAERDVAEKEFPNMSLDAPAEGEFAAQMIAYGWVITLEAGAKAYEYRADKYQLRLVNFDGVNYVVE